MVQFIQNCHSQTANMHKNHSVVSGIHYFLFVGVVKTADCYRIGAHQTGIYVLAPLSHLDSSKAPHLLLACIHERRCEQKGVTFSFVVPHGGTALYPVVYTSEPDQGKGVKVESSDGCIISPVKVRMLQATKLPAYHRRLVKA